MTQLIVAIIGFWIWCITVGSRLRRQLPINISNKQALSLWSNFVQRNISVSVQLQQQPNSNATIFSAYAETVDRMSLLFAIQSSTQTNQITLKFRDDKEQIKNYILIGSLGGNEFHEMIFALDDEVFQLTVDCVQLIKATDPHLSFRLKTEQPKLNVYLGNDIQANHTFSGVTRQFTLQKGNPTNKVCKQKLQINLSNPIRITTENNLVETERTAKSQSTIELIAQHGLELEKNINERLDRLEDKLNKLGSNLNTVEARLSFLEHLQIRPKRDQANDSHSQSTCRHPADNDQCYAEKMLPPIGQSDAIIADETVF